MGQRDPRNAVHWLRCEGGECHPIEGATQRTYKVAPADAGLSIELREAAVNAGGWNSAVSNPSRSNPDG